MKIQNCLWDIIVFFSKANNSTILGIVGKTLSHNDDTQLRPISPRDTLFIESCTNFLHYSATTVYTRQIFFLDTKKWTFDRQEDNFFSFITYLEASLNKVLHKHLSFSSSIWLSNCFCSNLINWQKMFFLGKKVDIW